MGRAQRDLSHSWTACLTEKQMLDELRTSGEAAMAKLSPQSSKLTKLRRRGDGAKTSLGRPSELQLQAAQGRTQKAVGSKGTERASTGMQGILRWIYPRRSRNVGCKLLVT